MQNAIQIRFWFIDDKTHYFHGILKEWKHHHRRQWRFSVSLGTRHKKLFKKVYIHDILGQDLDVPSGMLKSFKITVNILWLHSIQGLFLVPKSLLQNFLLGFISFHCFLCCQPNAHIFLSLSKTFSILKRGTNYLRSERQLHIVQR